MTILEEILATLPAVPVEEVRIGPFWTAVVVSRRGQRHCGLASTQLAGGDHHHGGPPVRWAGHLLEHSALELANLALAGEVGGPVGPEQSIAWAAINALLEVDAGRCREENALHTLAREGAGKRVALVGHFPFVPRLRPKVGQLDVLELRPRPGDLPADRAGQVLPQADVVAITGTALINHTAEGLLSLCRPGACVMMLGPSTPLSPVLFGRGVRDIAGTLVVDVETALRYLSEGATFQQMKGVRTLVMTQQGSADKEAD